MIAVIYLSLVNILLLQKAHVAKASNAGDDVDYSASNHSISNGRNCTRLEDRRLMLRTTEDKQNAAKLAKYFKLRDECPFELYKCDISYAANETSSNSSEYLSVKFCPSTADYLVCFPSTPVNQTFTFRCPFQDGVIIKDPNSFGSRYCQPNGQWSSTNYLICQKNVVTSYHPVDCRVKHKTLKNESQYIECDGVENAENRIYQVMSYANLIGFGITIVCVSLAILIFLSIRSLRCLRNMIHCNMLLTFLFKCSGHIGFYIFILSKPGGNIWENNHVMCVIFNVILNYSLLCSFFWMMIEAVYLITVIVAAYSSNKIKLWWYLIIGWVLPILPIIPYAILTFKSSQTTCSWIKPAYNSVHEMFIDVTIYILLGINCILLLVILYVIVTKLKHNDAAKNKFIQYKKLTRATLVLFPLFGLTFAVFFWLPTDTKTVFSKVYYFINIFLQTTQGVWVSFIYCFLNDEVKNAVRTKIRSWKITHVRSSLFGNSFRRQSTPTLYSTQMTSNNSTTRHRADFSPFDPAKLPMLQEEKV